MINRKNAFIIGLLGSLAFFGIISHAQGYAAPTSAWTWIAKTGVAYTWSVNVGTTPSTATWTLTALKNSSLTQGYANGTITGDAFTSNTALSLYTLDFTAETMDLSNANYFRTGGWILYTNLQATFPGGVTGNVTFPPTPKNTMLLLNKSLGVYVSAQWGAANVGPSNIFYLTGHAAAWNITYQHALNPLQCMNWSIAVTGLVKSFIETDAAGAAVASAQYNYPPVGFFGFDPSVDFSIWLGIVTIAVGVLYTLATKKQDTRDDAEDAALKKMVAEKAGSAPAPKKEGEK